MPYNPSTGVYQLPAIYLAVPGTTIIAAQHNDPLVDLQTANNYPRPVVAGGTGATTPAGARANLEVVSDTVAVTYTAPSVDNVVPRWNGTSGALQDSAIAVADNGDVTVTSTDAGAAAGPVDDLYRNSASPAANDIIGARQWTGEDSAGNKEIYAEDRVQILDPTSTSEDAKVVRRTVVAGTLADRVHTGAGMWMEGATGGDPGVGKFNAVEVQKNGTVLGITSGTAQNATGTAVNFTSIPAWVKRITVQFVGVSTNGSSGMIIQIGDAGGVETTGYTSGITNASNFSSETTGYIVTVNSGAGDAYSGSVVLSLQEAATNTWVCSGLLTKGTTVSTTVNMFAGSKALSVTLDRVRITMINGTDAFDAGSLNILYE